MDRGTYHHGDLKQELIHNGLILINKEGFEGFSIRKVAAMCGVSHNAPYKHFKDIDELIGAIVEEVTEKFHSALLEVTEKFPNDPKVQIIEMGKAYVRFMVENPEYLKFMFLSENAPPIRIENDRFYDAESCTFRVFRESAERYFKEINLNKDMYMQMTLTMWSMVHGLSILISKRSIECEGDYLELVERILKEIE